MIPRLLISLLLLAVALRAAEPASRPAGPPPGLAELVRQLGSDSYDQREAATKTLAAMGPEVVGWLEPYRKHADPEIALRIERVIATHAWLGAGAIVVGVVPDSQAQQVGIAPGDVILKADETDITGSEDLMRFGLAPRTYHVLSPDGLREVRIGQGKAGVWIGDWDRDTAGRDHRLGLSMLGQKRFAVAYRHLRRAYRNGVEDFATLNRLVGLAEHELDHPGAMDIVETFQQRMPGLLRTNFTRNPYGASGEDLPFENIRTALLLRQLQDEPNAVDLKMEIYRYALGEGHNTPWARQIASQNPPGETPLFNAAKLPDEWVFLAVFDGRHADLRNNRKRLPDSLPSALKNFARIDWGPPILLDHHDGTIKLADREVYLRNNGTWIPTGASPTLDQPIQQFWAQPTAPSLLRYLTEAFPPEKNRRMVVRLQTNLLGWDLYTLQAGRVLAVRRSDRQVADLSAKAAGLLKRNGPLAIYQARAVDDDTLLLPSEAGLLAMDSEGKLRRIDLPLKDPNVHLRLLDYPRREGKVYLGVAPQQGGQIVELDVTSGKTRLTQGFNGLGPDDAFSAWVARTPNSRVLEFCRQALQSTRNP